MVIRMQWSIKINCTLSLAAAIHQMVQHLEETLLETIQCMIDMWHGLLRTRIYNIEDKCIKK